MGRVLTPRSRPPACPSPAPLDDGSAAVLLSQIESLAHAAANLDDTGRRREIDALAPATLALLEWSMAGPGRGHFLARTVVALARTWHVQASLAAYGTWIDRAARADLPGELGLRVRLAVAIYAFGHRADHAGTAALTARLRDDAQRARAHRVYAAATVLWASTVFHEVSARDAVDGLEDALRHVDPEDHELRANLLARLGGLLYATGRHSEGWTRLEQARELAHSRRLRRAEAFALLVLGEVARGAQSWEDAVQYISRVVEIEKGSGAETSPTTSFNLANALVRMGRASDAATWVLKGLKTLDRRRSRTSAECALLAASGVMLRFGDRQAAVRLLAAADAATASTWEPSDRPDFDACLAELGHALTQAEFLRDWDAGRALDLPDALCLAHESLDRARGRPREPATGPNLSPREREVLELLVAGCPNRDIATTLVLSIRTVESHVANICGKLGARTRSQAAARAVAAGIVSPLHRSPLVEKCESLSGDECGP